MLPENIKRKSFVVGKYTCWFASVLGIVYVVTTVIGFLSLNSPDDPISDPYFTIMEILTMLIAPSMAISMIAVHNYASSNDKMYSLTALCFMFVMAGITSGVHFVILTVSHQFKAVQLGELFISFKWPSVVYALDILAWDWFFAISILFAAPVFKKGRLEKVVRNLMIICGLLSLVGLIGVPLANMQIRNIGIIGYALIAPFIFLLLGTILGQTKELSIEQTKTN
ncbi:MAG: hypothetical protein LH478_15360 [Chitinophagaceae bacterium]|nr:hypothetical protein [Chitinophagaceae bacterium]